MEDDRRRRSWLRRLFRQKKSGRPASQLTEEQQLILGLLLIVLVAISMLYCLGFASLAIRHNWERAPLPWTGTALPEEILESTPALEPEAAPTIP